MKIVAVLPASPHPFGDTAARWYYVLMNGLADAGHKVVCFVASEEPESTFLSSTSALNEGKTNPVEFRFFSARMRAHPLLRKIRSLVRPFSETAESTGLREALIDELASGYDVLHLEQLWTGWLGLDKPRTLLNIHHFEIIDLEGRKSPSVRDRKALFQMTRATKRILRGNRHFRMFTPRLLACARTIEPNAQYWVVPFALDTTLYPLQPAVTEPIVGLFGSMHWHPSRSAGERLITRIWPLIKEQVPSARLYVAGWNARKYLARYATSDDITLVENLEHPTDFFSRAALMLYAPSRGSGMKIKVMESMAFGVPVVTTWEGVEGIDCVSGVHCEVAESDEELASRAVSLLSSAERRGEMRAAARQLIEERYSPSAILPGMLEVLEAVASSGGDGATKQSSLTSQNSPQPA